MAWKEKAIVNETGFSRTIWRISVAAALVMLTACSGGERGMVCQGNLQTLEGRPLGNLEGKIVDRFTSFGVTLPKSVVESGPLHSADRQQYVPSAVTKEGWLAMRLSDTRFMIVNAPQDKVYTFSCPSRAI